MKWPLANPSQRLIFYQCLWLFSVSTLQCQTSIKNSQSPKKSVSIKGHPVENKQGLIDNFLRGIFMVDQSTEENYAGVWDSGLGFGEKSALIVIDLLQGLYH